jgi:hypothetical protein
MDLVKWNRDESSRRPGNVSGRRGGVKGFAEAGHALTLASQCRVWQDSFTSAYSFGWWLMAGADLF